MLERLRKSLGSLRTKRAKEDHAAPDGSNEAFFDEARERRPSGITAQRNLHKVLSAFVLDFDPKLLPGKDGASPLHYAVRSENFALLQNLVENEHWKWDVENVAQGVRGERPIHVAAEVNNLRAFRFLLAHGADPTTRQSDFHGLQPIHVAAANGAFDVLRYIINGMVSHDGKKFISALDAEGGTALHWAVLAHNLPTVQFLMEKGCSVDFKQTKGSHCTPLHYACIERSLVIVQLMAEVRPDEFRRALHMTDAEGSTPLHRAVVLDYAELVEFLIDKGSPLDILDDERRSPMILAAVREAWSSGHVLLKWGVNPVSCDPIFQRTTMHYAGMVGANPTDCQLLVEKMDENADWKRQLDALDVFGYSALQYAAGYGHVDSFHGLLKMGASLQTRNHKYKTVLHYAAKFGQLELVKTSLNIDPSIVNAMDHKGRSALHLASSHGRNEIVELLLSKGAFAFRDDSGRTAFHLAAAGNHQHIMESIGTYFGSTLNAADKDGNTALHLAAAENAAEAVLYLLNQLMHTRDVVEAITRENTDGFTPLDLVIRNKNERTALTFINHDHWKPLLMQYSKIHGTAVLGLIRHLPDAMRRLLDRCVTPPLHDEKGSFIEYDYTVLHHSTHATKVGHQGRSFNVPMRALKTMAVLRRSELLAHPVCSTLLERKWLSYGMYCSGIIMASNLVFVSVLSYVMMSTVERDLRTHLLRQSFENVERNHPDGCAAVNGSEFDFIRERIRQGREQPFSDTPALMVLGISLVIIFFKELAELRSEGPRYLLQWMNYMEMALFICSGGFVFCFYQDYRAHDVGPATYQFGALAIFLAWFNLLRFFRPFGTFGLYSFMFFTILRTLIQVSAFFFILTAAFTAATQTLFYTKIYPNNTDYYKRHSDLSPDDLRTIHEDVTITALRIGAMTIGDLDSLDNFMVPFMDGMLAYPELSFVFYAIFLVLMPILLNNLLMGLAIGDMEAIRENAISLRLEMQVYLHESLERLFPQRFLQRLQKQSETYRIYKGAPVGFLTKVARWMQTGDKSPEYLVQGNTVGVDEKAEEEANEKEENFTLQRRLKNLEEAAQEQRQLLNQILTKLERAPASGASEDVFAASIAEKARKRSERTEEDRRHAQRIQLLRKQASYQDSLRSDQSGDIDS